MRLVNAGAVVVLAMAGITLASQGLEAAMAPEVEYAQESRDAGHGRPLVTCHGRRLNRFKDFVLRNPAGDIVGLPDQVFASRDDLILGLPKGLQTGSYVLDLSDNHGETTSVPVDILNDGIGQGSVTKDDLDPALQALLNGLATRAELQMLPTKADLAGLVTKDDLGELAQKALKGTRCRTSSQASMAAAADFAAVSFDATDFDTDGCRYGGNDKIVCETEGYYLVTAKVMVGTGLYFLELRQGATVVGKDAIYAGTYGGSAAVTAAVHLKVDDELKVYMKNNQGDAFVVQPGSEFSMVKVGE